MSRKDSTDDDGMLLGESASMSSRSSSSKASLAKVAARKAALEARQARLLEGDAEDGVLRGGDQTEKSGSHGSPSPSVGAPVSAWRSLKS